MNPRQERRTTTLGKAADDSGFTVVQLLVVLTVAAILGAVAIMSTRSARDSLRLSNSVRQLASYLEKARLDAVRRHDTSSVVFTNNTTYNVTADFGGSGTPSTRTFSFESGVALITTPLPTLNFNWRGRTSACTLTFAVQNGGGEQSWVDVSDAGDVTINSNVDILPNANYGTVSTTSDIAPGTVVSGSAVHNNTADCNGGNSGTPGPPISGGGSGGCSVTANPSSFSIKKNGANTANVTVGTNGIGTSTVTASGPINLQISPTAQTVSAGGSASFSIKSLNNTRGTFAVSFSSPCTTVVVLVTVTN
jgi:Tfp pilus assembly protein PilE